MGAVQACFLFVLVGLLCVESKYIKYDTSSVIVPGKINVHLVAHTHDDVGWLKTVDQYYVGSNNSIQGACVQNVLDSIVPALLADKNRKFIYVEQAFFQRWWRDQSEEVQNVVKQLVSSGQLELINGGMCMHDEAAPHYIDMIDQTTLGHNSSRKNLISAGLPVGFDSFFFGRIDYQDRAKRKGDKSLEVVWRGSKSLGSSAQIFAGAFPQNYEPPINLYYEVNDDSPILQDNPSLFDYNVGERVNEFVSAAMDQANITRTNHVMWTMGTDFKYQYAHTWYKQMDKFIHYVNQDGRVNALYSTPSIYTDAKYATNESWPLKTDDFFPYADIVNAYWTGYFTSRPALKGYVRKMSGYYLAARQLEFFKGRSKASPNTDSLADALSLAQHHDAVSGTSKQHVANDYAKRLAIGYAERLLENHFPVLQNRHQKEVARCLLLNISYCPPSEVDLSKGKSLVVVVYNSLGWKREDVIRIPVINENVAVKDAGGKEIESQLLPLLNDSVGIRDYYSKAYLGMASNVTPKYWLAFTASLPPLGFNTYIISSSSSTASRAASTSSQVYDTKVSQNDTVEIGPGNLKLIYSGKGQLTQYINSRSLVKESVEQSYSYYAGDDGSKDKQASGAYIFRPNGTYSINAEGQDVFTVLRGPLLDEVHQRISSWIYQCTRGKEHAEVEFTVGPIPIEDGIGKEVVTKITTTVKNNKKFYTDSSGRDFIERVRDYRKDWELQVNQPIAGNYYPINLGLYMQDNSSEFSILVDRSVGGSSIVDGQLELMLHRGVGEALNETVCVLEDCRGLTIVGKYFLRIDPLREGCQVASIIWSRDIFSLTLSLRRAGWR
uniref:Alpha-mannosidase n=1 Tax=Salix viminalis TaxID=40686 RepID=A0A6N2KVZ4_SALVM